ncbi:MAG: hypothetical protein M1820_010758 [Bogoriella megaspora]|nr:MAG: hypothetical protein M1820_010758 [Bogoriella megaspora]
MKDIYLRAEQVIGWFGEDLDAAAEAFRFMQALHEKMSKVTVNLEESISFIPEDLARGTSVLIDLADDVSGWLAVQKMFNKTWLSRVWRIQEAVLAKQLLIQWGSEAMPWRIIEEVVHSAERMTPIATKLYGSSTSIARDLTHSLRIVRNETKISLPSLLGQASGHQSTDPRDRIYALLGLIKNTSFFGITPKYDISVQVLFRQAAAAMLVESKDLFILSKFQRSLDSRLAGIPSWVPDWTKGCVRMYERGFPDWYHFKADGRSQAEFNWHADPNLLTIRGKIDDTINDDRVFFDPKFVEMDLGFGDSWGSAILDSFRDIADFLDECTSLVPKDQLSPMSFWRALIGGLKENGKLADDQYCQHCEDYEKYVKLARKAASQLEMSECVEEWAAERKAGVMTYSRAILHAGNQRQFTLMDGVRPGWVPSWVKSGDKVAVLPGSRLPVIFRPCENGQWIWVSNCSIETIILGEAMDDDRYPTQNITLR